MSRRALQLTAGVLLIIFGMTLALDILLTWDDRGLFETIRFFIVYWLGFALGRLYRVDSTKDRGE